MSIAFDDDDERSAAAGEYVLGTLSDEDRRSVEARLPRDPRLAREVYAWQDRLLGLSARVEPVEPTAGAWSRIAARLDEPAFEGLAAGAPEVAEDSREGSRLGAAPSPAGMPDGAAPRRPTASPAPMRERGPTFWERLAVWRGIGALATAVAIVLAVRLVLAPEPAAVRYLAVLQAPDTRATGWIVEAAEGRPLRLVPVGDTTAVPDGRALQFWTKQDRAAGPTSLGLVRAGEALEVPSTALPGLEATQLFEITLEPEGGSTIGRPTGPVLYIGRALRL